MCCSIQQEVKRNNKGEEGECQVLANCDNEPASVIMQLDTLEKKQTKNDMTFTDILVTFQSNCAKHLCVEYYREYII